MDQQGGYFKRKRVNFTQVSNKALRDENLSLKAKGLYSLIQSYVTLEDFILYKNTLIKKCKDKEGSFNTAWKELKDNGYLVQEKKRNASGSFYYEYDLLDDPNVATICATPQKSTPGFPTCGSSTPGSSTGGEMGVYNNTDLNNTYLNNTKSNNTYNMNVINEIWTLYPKKKGKADAVKKIPRILKTISEEELKRCIERYKSEFKNNDYTYMVNGSTFFNGRYEDYLDENYTDNSIKNIEEDKRLNF